MECCIYCTLSIAEEIRCIDKDGQSWRGNFLVVVVVVIISIILFHQKPTKERYCRIVFDVIPSSSSNFRERIVTTSSILRNEANKTSHEILLYCRPKMDTSLLRKIVLIIML